MRILCVSDIHGKLDSLTRILQHEAPADLIVLAGDLTDRGTVEEARQIVAAARGHSPMVVAVSGNCDSPAIDEMLHAEDVGLHARLRTLGPRQFVGLSGVPGKMPWQYHFSEDEFAQILNTARAETPMDRELMLVTHTPPRGVVDRTTIGLKAGSRAVREWVDLHRPRLVICGHIHEAQGQTVHGQTTVVNCGPAFKCRYATVVLEDSATHVEIHKLK